MNNELRKKIVDLAFELNTLVTISYFYGSPCGEPNGHQMTTAESYLVQAGGYIALHLFNLDQILKLRASQFIKCPIEG